MNGMVQQWRRLARMAVAVAALSGCQWFTLGVGRMVEPERCLPLHEGGPHTGAWVTRDLVFSYEYLRRGDGMRIDGTLQFRGGIPNFPVMMSFDLQAYYLDANGQVVAVGPIYIAPRGRETGTWRFSRNLALPAEAAGWAIGYSGSAKDYGYPGDSVDWSFWDTPFP